MAPNGVSIRLPPAKGLAGSAVWQLAHSPASVSALPRARVSAVGSHDLIDDEAAAHAHRLDELEALVGDRDRLAQLLTDAGFTMDGVYGVFHGPRLAEMDARHGGSLIDAQIARAVADAPWPAELLADVAAVTAADFDIVEAATEQARYIDDSLDLVAIAVRPADDDDAGAAGIEEWRT